MNRKLWETMLSEQIPRLRRYARGLTQNTSEADDLVQDVLERAWDKRLSWQVGSNLRAWLFTIMHNVFVNGVRRNKMAKDYKAALTQSSPGYVEETPLLLRDLENCLAQLKPEYREVVLLAGLEGMSYKEIAAVTAVPLGTVMSRLSRGREELRELISEQQASKVVRIK